MIIHDILSIYSCISVAFMKYCSPHITYNIFIVFLNYLIIIYYDTSNNFKIESKQGGIAWPVVVKATVRGSPWFQTLPRREQEVTLSSACFYNN